MIAVEAEGLVKWFRPPASVRLLLRGRLRGAPVLALDGVSLRVERGEALGVMGPNGAGKSTLLRLVAGMLVPTAGSVRVCGIDASTGHKALARKIGYAAADDRGLSGFLPPRELLAWTGALHGLGRRDALIRADELIEQHGLRAYSDRPLRELSTGLRRRTALARAFVGRPEVLLLDEPTRGVDPAGTAALHRHLSAALAGGCALVLATHDAAEARALCKQVLVLDGARPVALEPPERAVDRLVGHA